MENKIYTQSEVNELVNAAKREGLLNVVMAFNKSVAIQYREDYIRKFVEDYAASLPPVTPKKEDNNGWITDRRPTQHDADEDGNVLGWTKGITGYSKPCKFLSPWFNIHPNQPWQKLSPSPINTDK